LIFSLLPYFIWNAFSTLRVYAICGRDWRIAAFVCFAMMGPIVGNIYDLPSERPVNLPPPYNCEVGNSVTIQLMFLVVLVSRISLIVGDAVVLAVTWWKTYRIKKAADAAQMKTSIIDLLLRDGSCCLLQTMLLLNILHIVINYVESVSFMGDIANVLTSVLISRFIMNLRDIDGKDTGQDSEWTGSGNGLGTWRAVQGRGGDESETRGTILFASNFAESMGGDLVHSMHTSTVPDSELSNDTQDDGQTGSAIEGKEVEGSISV
ncbi:hypothetical protein BC628DRAFT_1465142, partial [Trametes gibbosa]